MVHAVLLRDEYVVTSDDVEPTYREGLRRHLWDTVGQTRQDGGYAIIHEVAESPFFQHIIEGGEHRKSHRVINVVADATRPGDSEEYAQREALIDRFHSESARESCMTNRGTRVRYQMLR